MLVSVTTWTNNLCDPSCILDVGDHDWLKHKSWVMYRKTRTELATTLDNGLEIGVFEARSQMIAEVFDRVCAGVLASKATPRNMKRYYRVQSGL